MPGYPLDDFGNPRTLDEIKAIMQQHAHRQLSAARARRDINVSTFETTRVDNASFAGLASSTLIQRQSVGESRRVTTVLNPLNTLSVYEPGREGGCQKPYHRERVSVTSQHNDCIYASNAGFFDVSSGPSAGACFGDLISDGRTVQLDGRHNVHFGIRTDNSIEVGYLDPQDVYGQDGAAGYNGSKAPFKFLLTGAIWLVRDGRNYVNESMDIEDPDIQTTGNLKYFAEVQSARTALGHDALGAVKIVQWNGKTNQRGTNLYGMADFLISLGIVNAINLDGGGSSVSAAGGIVTSYPSDQQCNCPWPQGNANCKHFCTKDTAWAVERAVTTILCAHVPRCTAFAGCGPQGQCVNHSCVCSQGYEGTDCSVPTTATTTAADATSTTTAAPTTTSSSTSQVDTTTTAPPRTSTIATTPFIERYYPSRSKDSHWQAAVGVLAALLTILIGVLIIVLRGRGRTRSAAPIYRQLDTGQLDYGVHVLEDGDDDDF
eukprot:TRINITY_DN10918_c0_g2_i2.p1 TRINITY_DN10918_c0_g2~~TRINITY_DN10918_c0_g2_i2.p1  ORF type:complete len:520 (+),score=78.76 TRINITY_DN10918_c0_g2_i2:95-1561(+)